MGGVGLMGLSIAKGTGFEKVVAIDIDDARLTMAREQYGADLTANSAHEGAAQDLLSSTGGLAAIVDRGVRPNRGTGLQRSRPGRNLCECRSVWRRTSVAAGRVVAASMDGPRLLRGISARTQAIDRPCASRQDPSHSSFNRNLRHGLRQRGLGGSSRRKGERSPGARPRAWLTSPPPREDDLHANPSL